MKTIYLVTSGMPTYMSDNVFYVETREQAIEAIKDEMNFFLEAWEEHEVHIQREDYILLEPTNGGPPWEIEFTPITVDDNFDVDIANEEMC